MRSIWRTLDRELMRDVGAMAAVFVVVGVSFGAIAVSEGIPVWLVITMSSLVFAGAAQFMTIGILASGGGALAALVAALLLNTRFVPLGMAVSDVLGDRLPGRLAASYLLIDEPAVFAIAQRDQSRRRAAYWACGVALFVAWNCGSLVGALAGQVIGEPDTLGLDAALPAGLLALLMPSLRESPGAMVAALGAVVALATTPVLPAGLPVLLSLVGLVVAVRQREPAQRSDDAPAEREGSIPRWGRDR